MAPTALSSTLSTAQKEPILDAITTTITHLHDATSVMAFCETLFGKEATDKANEERKKDAQLHFEIDGSTGEAPANRSSARAYVLMFDAGEKENAQAWSEMIISKHFQKTDFVAEVEKVRGSL